MLELLKPFYSKLKKSPLDDFVDRCHYFISALLLILFAFLVGGQQVFGSPIQCMAPAEYGGHWGSYVDQFCYITRTYITESGHYEPTKEGDRIDVSYYQWVPYVLGLQALLFYAPHFVWKYLLSQSDVDFESIVNQCSLVRSSMIASDDKKRKSNEDVVSHLQKIYNNRQMGALDQAGLGDVAIFGYLSMKLLNLLVAIIQLLFITEFVGRGRLGWGFKVLSNSLRGVYWDNTGFFPRVTFCDFGRETLGNMQMKVAQCALPINFLNEKIYLFLYFWFLLLIGMGLVNLLHTGAVYFVEKVRIYYGRKYLKLLDATEDSSYKNKDELIMAFILEVLGRDGLLLLRFIDSHAGRREASEIACSLFKEVSAVGGDKDDYYKI